MSGLIHRQKTLKYKNEMDTGLEDHSGYGVLPANSGPAAEWLPAGPLPEESESIGALKGKLSQLDELRHDLRNLEQAPAAPRGPDP